MSTSTANKNNLTKEDIEYLFNELRKASIIWSGRKECLARARKKFFVRLTKRGKRVYKYYWRCAKCKEWFRNEADVQVDHIQEIGGVTAFDGDWNTTIQKIFPRPVEKHLQCICVICHQKKTAAYMSASIRYSRKSRG